MGSASDSTSSGGSPPLRPTPISQPRPSRASPDATGTPALPFRCARHPAPPIDGRASTPRSPSLARPRRKRTSASVSSGMGPALGHDTGPLRRRQRRVQGPRGSQARLRLGQPPIPGASPSLRSVVATLCRASSRRPSGARPPAGPQRRKPPPCPSAQQHEPEEAEDRSISGLSARNLSNSPDAPSASPLDSSLIRCNCCCIFTMPAPACCSSPSSALASKVPATTFSTTAPSRPPGWPIQAIFPARSMTKAVGMPTSPAASIHAFATFPSRSSTATR